MKGNIVVIIAALLLTVGCTTTQPPRSPATVTATHTVTRSPTPTTPSITVGGTAYPVPTTIASSHAPITPNPSPPSTYVDVLHTGKPLPGAFTIMYALRAKGFDVSDVTPTSTAMAKDSLDVKINGISAYLNAFPDVATTRQWTVLSVAFGGIAVVGDTWAVSLDSQGKTATPAQSKALAAKIARALDAQVKIG